MVPLVPSDLVEYPIINYLKYRNKGKIKDEDLSSSLISRYTQYYRRDPRDFFLEDFKADSFDIKWNKPVSVGRFLRFSGQIPSPFRPLSLILQQQKYHRNLRMIAYHYRVKKNRNSKNKKTVVLFIHGFAETTFSLHEMSYFRLFDQIFHSDIFAFELPYHFHRQPNDSPFSGAYYLNGNPIRMLEAIRQSIQEILFIIQYYLKEKYERVIMFGISLGGHLAALTTQFLTDVDIICALASPFIFRLNSKIVPISTDIVSQLKRRGRTNWYKILYACNLKYFAPYTTNPHTAIIGGHYDRIVQFDRVQNLARMLKKPLYSYPGGHLSLIFWLRSLLRKINENYS